MKHLPRIFLVSAVIAFAIGMSDLAENTFFYMGRPVGAILFILFMIFQFLDKEAALYDQEQKAKTASLRPRSKTSLTANSHGEGYHREIPVKAAA